MKVYQILEYQSYYDDHAVVLRGTYLNKNTADRIRDSLNAEEMVLRKMNQACDTCIDNECSQKYRCSRYEAFSEKSSHCKNDFNKSYESFYKVAEVEVIED